MFNNARRWRFRIPSLFRNFDQNWWLHAWKCQFYHFNRPTPMQVIWTWSWRRSFLSIGNWRCTIFEVWMNLQCLEILYNFFQRFSRPAPCLPIRRWEIVLRVADACERSLHFLFNRMHFLVSVCIFERHWIQEQNGKQMHDFAMFRAPIFIHHSVSTTNYGQVGRNALHLR